MSTATFKMTMAYPPINAPLGGVIAFLEETVEVRSVDILGVKRIGTRASEATLGLQLPLFEVTVAEDAVSYVAEWFNRTLEQFETDFEVEWKAAR